MFRHRRPDSRPIPHRPRASLLPLALVLPILLGPSLARGSEVDAARTQDGVAPPSFHTGGEVGPIVVTDDRVFVARGLRVVAVERESAGLGAELGVSEPLAGLPLAMARSGDRLVVATERGTVEVLAVDGDGAPRILERIAAHEASAALAVADDGRAYHIGAQELLIIDPAATPSQVQRISLRSAGAQDRGKLATERRLAVVGRRLFINDLQTLRVLELVEGERLGERTSFRISAGVDQLAVIDDHVYALTRQGVGNSLHEVLAIDAAPNVVPHIVGRWADSGSYRDPACGLFALDGVLGVSAYRVLRAIDVRDPSAMREIGSAEVDTWCELNGQSAAYASGLVVTQSGREHVRPVAFDATAPSPFTPDARRRVGMSIGPFVAAGDMAFLAEGRQIQRFLVTPEGEARAIATVTLDDPVTAMALDGERLWIGTPNGAWVARLDAAPGRIEPIRLELPEVGRVEAIQAEGSRVAVATDFGLLMVVDASDLGAPRILATLQLNADAQRLVGHGNTLFAIGGIGIEIVDLSDPGQARSRGLIPEEIGTTRPTDFATDGRTVWRIGPNRSIAAIDITDPSRGFPTVELPLPYGPSALTGGDGLLFVSRYDGAVTAYDVTTPGILRAGETAYMPFDADQMHVAEERLYVRHSRGGLAIVPAPHVLPETVPTPPATARHLVFLPRVFGAGD